MPSFFCLRTLSALRVISFSSTAAEADLAALPEASGPGASKPAQFWNSSGGGAIVPV